jgi:CelD/BcsL family acetyltransferase involved in cellulose biosynthesis
MADFFRSLAIGLAEDGIVKLFTLRLDEALAAAVMCFDYQSVRYLYNNAYDQRFGHLSVGVISKVLSLKDAVESDLRRYDFLKGGELYKERLGGKPVQLYDCRIDLS